MQTISPIRVVSLKTALAEISRIFAGSEISSYPIVVVDRNIHADKELEISNDFFKRLPRDFTGDLLFALTTLPELRAAGLPIGRAGQHFAAGQPIMISVLKVHELPERQWGGQTVSVLERRARDGLYVTVAFATEALRAYSDFTEHRKIKPDTRRLEIFEQLKTHLPLSAKNCFAEGQKLVTTWFPGNSAYRTMQSLYQTATDELVGGKDTGIYRAAMLDQVHTAAAIYTKASDFLKAQHVTSEALRELLGTDEFRKASAAAQHDIQARLAREMTPSAHQDLAHDKQGGPSLAQLLRAARTMDFNPAWVFTNMIAYHDEFECAIRLGRAERIGGVMLESEHISRLRHWMAMTDDPDRCSAGEAEPAHVLRQMASRVKTAAAWIEFFEIAEKDGGALWITKTPTMPR